MNRIFKVDGKAPIVNPALFLEASPDDKYLACLSERDVFIIRSYLWPYVTWQTRFARAIGDGRYQLAEEGELREFIQACYELDYKITGGDFMACLDSGLSEIAQALRYMADRKCCDGQSNLQTSGGIVGTYTDAGGVTRPIYGSEELYELPPEGFPPEFEDEEAYLLNKCQVANLVFDGWLTTMRGLGGLTVFNAVALAGLIGAAFAGIIVFPLAAIPVMIGALLALAGFIAMFDTICDELQANKAEIVCSLYNSNTVEEMTAALGEALDAAIALLEVAGPIAAAFKTVALLIVNGDTLNQVMSGVAGLSYPDADCSGCVSCQTFVPIEAFEVYPGTQIDTQDENGFTASPVGPFSDRSRYDVGVYINVDESFAICGVGRTLTELTIAPALSTGPDATAGLRIFDRDDEVIYESFEPVAMPELPLGNVGYIYAVSYTDFTVDAVFEPM